MTRRAPSRRRLALASGVLLLTALTACGGGASGGSSTPGGGTPGGTVQGTGSTGPAPHVMVIVMENQEYSDVIGHAGTAPYINQLAGQYGLATDYHARTHPSLPNYIDLIAGSTMSISGDCTDCSTDGDTLVDQLAKKSIHWTAYMENMPQPCALDAYYPSSTTTEYAKKHNPFIYFDHLRTDPTACQNIVPYTQFAADLKGSDPSPFMWITPSLCDDGHNTEAGCGLGGADRWLANNLPPILASSWYAQNGIVVVTWDEGSSNAACCGGAHGGKVATLVISKSVKAGARLDTPVAHTGLLRTIEAIYGLDYLRTAADPQSGDLMPLLGRQRTF
ncbi:MAG TPA: alkaline phosphatase family protein [Candidatus Dormibacteraeota bacterium]|jgi:acid phosphatase|nr:alkaline phosphatase family protein [Candidatus Dormibacteraeota bacterium]